jgi:hypothetical protein
VGVTVAGRLLVIVNAAEVYTAPTGSAESGVWVTSAPQAASHRLAMTSREKGGRVVLGFIQRCILDLIQNEL